jgi:polyisoprenyl-teichoic acid--peptidoglycan teichoic acid transferase
MRNKRFRNQIILLILLVPIFCVSSGMILLAFTAFRSQIPLFRLMTGNPILSFNLSDEPQPQTNPGVKELIVPDSSLIFVVLGSDCQPDAGFRTDVIMLVSYNQLTGNIGVVSIPRDLWVNIPGYGENRINIAFQVGSFQLLSDTIHANFGIYPTEYAMADCTGFVRLIEIFEGVEVEVSQPLADECYTYIDPDGWCEVNPGTVYMDPYLALWYIRSRNNSSDFERMQRTQEVLKAIVRKGLSPEGLSKIPEIMQVYQEFIITSFTIEEISSLLPVAFSTNMDNNINLYWLQFPAVTDWTTPDGAMVLVPDIALVQQQFIEAFELPPQ